MCVEIAFMNLDPAGQKSVNVPQYLLQLSTNITVSLVMPLDHAG